MDITPLNLERRSYEETETEWEMLMAKQKRKYTKRKIDDVPVERIIEAEDDPINFTETIPVEGLCECGEPLAEGQTSVCKKHIRSY